MTVKWTNDWRYLFDKNAMGGRFAAFTFFNLALMRHVDPLVDGFIFTILGLGFVIKPGKGE